MAVFRVERIKDYTVMSNHHLRNKNLSLKAKGLLSQMLSLPDDWDYTLKGLAAINKESVDAIRTAIWELEDALALQVSGIPLTAVATRMSAPPNHVSAWISRAVHKLRNDESFLSSLHEN